MRLECSHSKPPSPSTLLQNGKAKHPLGNFHLIQTTFVYHFWQQIRESLINWVIAKLPTKFIDIKKLRATLLRNGVTPLQFVRLFCLSGNDFCAGCSVATPKTLLRTFLKHKEAIGDLSNEENVRRLYYAAFVVRYSPGTRLPPSQLPIFSVAWCVESRTTIAYRTQTKSACQLLPQDDDNDLQFRRIQCCISDYWALCSYSTVDEKGCETCGGYDSETGGQLVCTESAVLERSTLIKSMLPPKCGCGKTASQPCCKDRRCSCFSSGSGCGPSCSCNRIYCNNKSEGNDHSFDETTVVSSVTNRASAYLQLVLNDIETRR